MFSLHVDTARSWRGGQNQVLLTVLGLRAQGHRTALVAHPDGELRRRAAEGPDLIPIASSGEMGFRAAWQLSRGQNRFWSILRRRDHSIFNIVLWGGPNSIAIIKPRPRTARTISY